MRILPSARHLLVLAGITSTLLLAACAGDIGPAGTAGATGPAGAAGPTGSAGADGAAGTAGADGNPAVASPAGMSLDKDSYIIGSDRSFTITGWGFQPGEPVLISLHTDVYGPGIVDGVDANDFGTFETRPGGRFRMDRVKSSPGTYTVWAEGASGSKAAAAITFVAAE